MKKSKVLIFVLCLCFSLQLTACGLGKEDTKWIKEDAKKISTDITSGEFVIDGEVYSFPMNLQDIFDKGWHVSNNYENVNTFELEPGEYTESFYIFKDGDKENALSVSVINMTDEKAAVDKCFVLELNISDDEFDFLLPGEITKRSTQKEVEAAYGEPEELVKEGVEKVYTYTYTSENGYNCSVELNVFNEKNATYPLSDVKYSITYFDMENIEEECRIFIDSGMKTSFYNDSKEYVANLFDSKEGAQSLYEGEVEYFASYLMYYIDIDEEYMSDDIIKEFKEISKKVLSKVKWEITDIDVEEDEYSGTVELKLYPTNYLDVIDSKVDEVIDTFDTKYADFDWDTSDEAKLEEVELDYAKMILDAIKGMEDGIENKDGIVKTYDISDEILTDEQWDEIDDTIMDIEYED